MPLRQEEQFTEVFYRRQINIQNPNLKVKKRVSEG